MVSRRGISKVFPPRARLAGAALGILLAAFAPLPAQAALLPSGFFDFELEPGQGAAGVEADILTYDSQSDVISAEGSVVLSYAGYVIKADRLDYNQRTGALTATGNVTMTDPSGSTYVMDEMEVTAGMKQAFLNSMTLTTAEGAVITADKADYSKELQTILTGAAYSPCGLCVDSKGRKIGWRVRATRVIYDRQKASVILEQPSLELLGIPVAWLPWMWVPDPSQPRATGLRMPSLGYDSEQGVTLTTPYFVPVSDDIDLVLSPRLMSRQGVLFAGDLTWRFPGWGQVDVGASGLYQLDKSAYAGTVGELDWRGAIQTSGRFTPTEDWTVGWTYSVFSDNAYLGDYGFSDAKSATNQAYATYLNGLTWLDARVQRFNRLGNVPTSEDAQQAVAIPNVEAEHVQDLGLGMGRVRMRAEALGVRRESDLSESWAPATYDFGFAGNKAHVMGEAAWENLYVLPGGVTATPYLGLRADASWYDGGSANPNAPIEQALFSATPIAALDVRWPLVSYNGDNTFLFEPVAQIVYRGSSTTLTGITNDDSQGFVFDTASLFDYNRFTGIDRQETGLRANVGGHYLANFTDGSWIDLVAGQSFHLAGVNALGIADPSQEGASTGLDGAASYIVGSVRGGLNENFSGAAKASFDLNTMRFIRAGVGVRYGMPGLFSGDTSYAYIAADPALGFPDDQHQVATNATLPIIDYWSVTGGLTYDLQDLTWAEARGGVHYDDGYLKFGTTAKVKPTSWSFGIEFGLKGPDGEIAF